MVLWDPPGVPRVSISGPHHGIFSKLDGPGPLGSRVTPIPVSALVDFTANNRHSDPMWKRVPCVRESKTVPEIDVRSIHVLRESLLGWKKNYILLSFGLFTGLAS